MVFMVCRRVIFDLSNRFVERGDSFMLTLHLLRLASQLEDSRRRQRDSSRHPIPFLAMCL